MNSRLYRRSSGIAWIGCRGGNDRRDDLGCRLGLSWACWIHAYWDCLHCFFGNNISARRSLFGKRRIYFEKDDVIVDQDTSKEWYAFKLRPSISLIQGIVCAHLIARRKMALLIHKVRYKGFPSSFETPTKAHARYSRTNAYE
jgi:hypothetical protein